MIFWWLNITLIIWLDMCADGTFFSLSLNPNEMQTISREKFVKILRYIINNKIYTHDDDVAGSNWITHRLQGLLRLLWAAIRSRERERRKKKKIKNITNRRWRSPGTWHIHLLIMLFAIGLSAYYYYYL